MNHYLPAQDVWRLSTGDAGYLDDDGYLYLAGRLKDMYITGGSNVYAAEVERVLADHPGVAEAAVIGVPDAMLGEVGLAFLIPPPGPASTSPMSCATTASTWRRTSARQAWSSRASCPGTRSARWTRKSSAQARATGSAR